MSGAQTEELTRRQTGIAMLAILNDRYGVKGSRGAIEFLADALECTVDEATKLEKFEFRGVQFEKRLHIERSRMGRRWEVVE